MSKNIMYYFYILKNPFGQIYIGSSSNLQKRINRHNSGIGANYTSIFRNFELVYKEEHQLFKDAIRRERQVKGWSRAKKEALISGDFKKLKKLSKSRK